MGLRQKKKTRKTKAKTKQNKTQTLPRKLTKTVTMFRAMESY